MINLIKSLVNGLKGWGATSWLKGLIATVIIGGGAAGYTYVFPQDAQAVKEVVEAPLNVVGEGN